MGSRAADKLKEIEDLRSSLGRKLEEIEQRMPLAGLGKKAAAALAGSSVAGSAVAFGLRRLRGGGRRKAKRLRGRAEPVLQTQPVNVNVFPKGAAWLAAAGLAAWAGVKVYDSLQRAKAGTAPSMSRPAVVTPMPETERRSAGS